jgi:hypothetical protein
MGPLVGPIGPIVERGPRAAFQCLPQLSQHLQALLSSGKYVSKDRCAGGPTLNSRHLPIQLYLHAPDLSSPGYCAPKAAFALTTSA